MARDNQEHGYSSSRQSGRKPRRWYRWGALLFIGLLLLIGFLPRLLTQRSILVGAANRFGGLAPLTIDLTSASAGWWAPVSITGLTVTDDTGNVVARVASLKTEKGLLDWIFNSQDLGIIAIDGAESIVVAKDGTTNLEMALEPILSAVSSEETSGSSDPSAALTGTISVTNSKLMLMEAGRPEQWLIELEEATVEMPSGDQLLGPIAFQARVGDASGTVSGGIGTIAAEIAQVSDSQALRLRAQLNQVPLNFWHVVRARLPELPIDELAGRASAVLSGTIATAESWDFDVQQLQTQSVQVVAPELLGSQPAQLEIVSFSGKASLDGQFLRVDGASLTCDFANAAAQAVIPWPLTIPSAADPFLRGATLEANGTVDLPRLVKAAETLIPVREGTQLLAGQVQFAVSQTLDAAAAPDSRASLKFAGLKAIAAGQNLVWDKPLAIDVSLIDGPKGPQIGAQATADFMSIEGQGTLESGEFSTNLDLQQLHERLSQWVDIPVESMNGALQLNLGWTLAEGQTLAAEGTLDTTPLTVVSTAGGELQEPAWRGSFQAGALLKEGVPHSLTRAKLVLEANTEQLTLDLREPLLLVTPEAPDVALPPAAFTIDLVGDLKKWERRAMMWLAEPPEMSLDGNLNLAVEGRIDLNHVEVFAANWRSQPIGIATPSMSFSEAQMVGSFKGVVDTSQLTRLAIEDLKVQATSFSISARDSASDDSSGSRVGEAVFLVDLGRLMKSVGSTAPPPTQNGVPATQVSAQGRVQGQLTWQVNTQQAGVRLQANADKLAVTSVSAGSNAPETLWAEPTLGLALNGRWVAETGNIDVDSLQMQTDWLTYNGDVSYRGASTSTDAADLTSAVGTQSVVMKGQAVYDCSKLSTKLVPMTGNQFQMQGQQSVPVEVQWTSSVDPTASVLAGLQATARIGWEQARVAGIELGRADVPIQISQGVLSTATEIPVSGGKLRWDIQSDLTAADLVINQKPMTVLENVEITEEMCQGWLKYVAPLLAETTSVDGRLSLQLDQAILSPADTKRQTVVGKLLIHQAQVGPGPLSNSLISLVRQLDAIRKQDFTQAVSSQKVWLDVPEQQIDFQMVDGLVSHRNLSVKIGDANIATSGSVGIDGQLALQADLPIPDKWIEKTPLLLGLKGKSLQFPMRGTLSQPQMDTQSLQQLGRQTIQSAAQGALQQGLSKGLEKLFGAPPTAQ